MKSMETLSLLILCDESTQPSKILIVLLAEAETFRSFYHDTQL